MKKINFTETVLRDANQSLIATRMPIDKFESILGTMDEAGYYSVECWGGATFDVCIRYLNEDPWERLKIIRKNMPNTKLQMLLRGQSLLGYKHYPDDVVRQFVKNAVKNGIDIIRIFDAMNDIQNIKVAVEETLKCGAHPSCAISYTTSPLHNIENYIKQAKDMENMGAQSICIKDMAGILLPQTAFELVTQLKKNVQVPIVLHSHCTTGSAYMTYLKAIEAGVDVIDTAISSFSGGTSQPATETMLKVVQECKIASNLNITKLNQINQHFAKVMDEAVAEGMLNTKVMITDSGILETQIPGGMYSNLISQLKQQNMMDRFKEVLEEVSEVRKDLGYPPLVTPISQMVGTQAAVNILSGERYKMPISELKAYFRGEYGTPPGSVNKQLMQKLVETQTFNNERYSLSLKPMYEEVKEKVKDKNYSENDLMTILLFPELGEKFIENRENRNSNTYRYSYQNNLEEMDYKKVDLEDDVRAILIAVLAYKLQITISAVQIKSVYEIK